jgi:DNA repair protein RadC
MENPMQQRSFVKNDHGLYEINGAIKPDDILKLAADILYEGLSHNESMTKPADIARFLQLKLQHEEHENFAVLFLNAKHRIITYQKVFSGTIDSATIYPRVVAKLALTFNAAAVVVAHNHPSNDCEPSEADKRLTRQLQDSLGLVDVRVLDHFIVSRSGWVSFAERGLL